MITVNYKDYKLTIEGHAGSDAYGHDLVCASATILFYTCVENFEIIKDDYKLQLDIRANSGDAHIKVIAPKPIDLVEEIFHTILVGYKVLEGMNPEFIRVIWDA